MQHELFPREVISDVPRITLTGNTRLHVEQHQGIAICRETEICLHTACGELQIRGQELCILRYTGMEALIAGRIESIVISAEGRRQ